MAQTLPRDAMGVHADHGRFRIRELHSQSELRAALSTDRPFAAYALAHLEPDLARHTRFWVAEGDRGAGLVMHSSALGQTTVTMGDPDAVAAITAVHPGPRATYLTTGHPIHAEAIGGAYYVSDVLRMQRMSVTRLDFHPAEGTVRRLSGRDTARINWLYAEGDAPHRYSPEAIERAIYYGVVEGDLLVAIAGTHVVAPNESIAVVGNVFTHPRYRGRGYATRATSAVTRDLLDAGCGEVVLTVDPANTPAVAAYRRLGYLPGSAVIEAPLRRRDAFGLSPRWRQMRARRRGAALGDGIELVTMGRTTAREDRR